MSAQPASGRVGPVSAVVCNYQGERYLAACLDALLALEGGIDELLVVDNASTDGSLALLAERYPSARVVAMGRNAGPAAARNAGMRAARNRWVLAVDNDAVCAPDLLAKLRAAAEADPARSILQPRSLFHHEPGRVHYDGGAVHYVGLVSLRNWYRPRAQAQGEGVVAVDVAISLCLLVDAQTVLALGGYDERYFILFEDLDLSFRLRLAGHAIASVEDALVRHDAGTPGVSFRGGRRYPRSRVLYHSRNRWMFLLKCFAWRTLLLSLPALALYELVWLGFAVVQGGLGAWARGKWEVARGMRGLLASRREVQARRRTGDRELLVGGPLTVTPALESGPLGVLLRALDAALRLWWRLVRPLVGRGTAASALPRPEGAGATPLR